MPALILLVDDDPLCRAMGSDLLTRDNWRIETVESAEAAIAAMERTRPQLLITDIHMPGQDGLALTAHTVAHYPEVPVVVLTGHGNEKTAVESFRLGAADYVRKENIRVELVRCAEKLLREEIQVEQSIRFPSSKEAPKKMPQETGKNTRRDGLASEYIVRRWGDAAIGPNTEKSNENEFCEQRLRVLRRQVERLDKWATLNASADKRDKTSQAFADVVYMIPVNSGKIEIEKRFMVFCRNLSQNGCSVIRNGLLQNREWVIFFPHQGSLDSRSSCFMATVMRDNPIPLGMYEISFVFGGKVELNPEDVAVMQARKPSAKTGSSSQRAG